MEEFVERIDKLIAHHVNSGKCINEITLDDGYCEFVSCCREVTGLNLKGEDYLRVLDYLFGIIDDCGFNLFSTKFDGSLEDSVMRIFGVYYPDVDKSKYSITDFGENKKVFYLENPDCCSFYNVVCSKLDEDINN